MIIYTKDFKYRYESPETKKLGAKDNEGFQNRRSERL